MSLALDIDFINRISFSLDGFEQQRNNLFRFRCPICGDGKSNNGKKRGFFYISDKGSGDHFSYFCHNNAGCANSFAGFLKEFDELIYDEYKLERFKESGSYIRKRPEGPYMHDAGDNKFKTGDSSCDGVKSSNIDSDEPYVDPILNTMERVDQLWRGHPAVEYFISRKFPGYMAKHFYFTNDFKSVCEEFNKDPSASEKIPSDPRFVIPFINPAGEVTCLQGRAIIPDAYMRYITMKKYDGADKIYGRDRLTPGGLVAVLEGPLDSCFIKNAVAVADGNLASYPHGDVYVFDKEPRNPDMIRNMKKVIALKKKIVIWNDVPTHIKGKDINDIVLNGCSMPQLMQYLISHTYSGLKADLEMTRYIKFRKNKKFGKGNDEKRY